MRPATPLICAFVDAHKDAYGVAPICCALAVHSVQIAPRTRANHVVLLGSANMPGYDKLLVLVMRLLVSIVSVDQLADKPAAILKSVR